MSTLSIFTLSAAILYSKRINEAHNKYVEAKNVVDDIIVSFNRQLQKQEDRVETSTHKVNVLFTHDELFAERLENQEKKVQALVDRVESFSYLEKATTRIDVLENKLGEVTSMKGTLLKKIAEIEKQRLHRKDSAAEIESAIPIKRERVLAPLTATELTVLEFLAVEGEKTAPEIKEQIKLSREHTARLMKKLYEKGYLERSANKIPFTYRLNEEMQKILKKPEQKS
ncbi:MAG: MarR family transcriptional regulator [Candidatus Bathyarchaeota archaeon]|nr:MarR family transcriptional regulator [Candidatus Bathyarchaeota archaeon]